MKKFPLLNEVTVQTREAEWLQYEGASVFMRHGFYLSLRPGCDYSRKRFVYRITEATEIDFLQRIFKPVVGQARVFFDVGANIGYLTKVMASRHFLANVYAFEPDKVTFDILKKNTLEDENVRIFQVAIGDKSGDASLYFDSSDSGDSSLLKKSGRSSYKVALITFDSLIKELGITRVDFIKVDIQGGEIQFFRGASDSINRFRPVLLVEVMSEQAPGITQFIANFAQENRYNLKVVMIDEIIIFRPLEFLNFHGDVNVFLIPKELGEVF